MNSSDDNMMADDEKKPKRGNSIFERTATILPLHVRQLSTTGEPPGFLHKRIQQLSPITIETNTRRME